MYLVSPLKLARTPSSGGARERSRTRRKESDARLVRRAHLPAVPPSCPVDTALGLTPVSGVQRPVPVAPTPAARTTHADATPAPMTAGPVPRGLVVQIENRDRGEAPPTHGDGEVEGSCLRALSLRIRDDPRLAAQGLVGRESFSPKSSVELSTETVKLSAETVKLSAETVKLSGGNGKISSRSGDSVDHGGRKFP